MVYKRTISAEQRAFARLLSEELGWSIRRIAKKLRISKSSVHRIKNNDIHKHRVNVQRKGGRPPKLSPRNKRCILRSIEQLRETEGFFTAEHLLETAGISKAYISIHTLRRFLKTEGIHYLNARQKGILTPEDRKNRVQYCKNVKAEHPANIWTDGIAFYLDGVTFVHKTNPKQQVSAPRKKVWRRKCEGLKPGCIAKGRKEGTGANVVKLMVAVAYGKGVIICEEYEKLNGEYFADFIKRNFIDMYGAADKDNVSYFVQDGDRSQNSSKAMEALKRVKAEVFPIPPRSPDLNPIENVFHLAKKDLRKTSKLITRENREEFVARIRRTLHNIPIETIDKTISSMTKRVDMIIKANGNRVKY